MDRNTIVAMVLCLGIFLGWQKFVIEPRMGTQNPAAVQQAPAHTSGSQETTSAQPTSVVNPTVASHPQTDAKPSRSVQTTTLDSGTGSVTLSDTGAMIQTWKLKDYRLGLDSSSENVEMHNITNLGAQISLAFDDQELAYAPEAQGILSTAPGGARWSFEDQKIKMSREFSTSPDAPYVDLKISAEFKGKKPKYAYLYLTSKGFDKDPEAQDRQFAYWSNQSVERINLKESVEQKEVLTPVKYIAATNRYFILSVIDHSGLNPKGLVQPTTNYSGRISLVYPVNDSTLTIPVRLYFGPKELDLLRKVEPTLDNAVDFGFFTVFAYPLLRILKWLYQFAQNYGVAIIALTLLLKVLTYPLTYKSMKSMKNMAKLQPQLQKIREKYKDDKEALNREMLTLMKTHGYNPMAGCLPMVIQMPVFFALYRVLYSSIELYHAPFALWIKDLSLPDPFYVTPILLSLTMFVQQKLTPNTATDPAQAKMMQFMPLVFGAFMLSLPSGLTVYMLVNAIAGIAQQMILNKKLEPAQA